MDNTSFNMQIWLSELDFRIMEKLVVICFSQKELVMQREHAGRQPLYYVEETNGLREGARGDEHESKMKRQKMKDKLHHLGSVKMKIDNAKKLVQRNRSKTFAEGREEGESKNRKEGNFEKGKVQEKQPLLTPLDELDTRVRKSSCGPLINKASESIRKSKQPLSKKRDHMRKGAILKQLKNMIALKLCEPDENSQGFLNKKYKIESLILNFKEIRSNSQYQKDKQNEQRKDPLQKKQSKQDKIHNVNLVFQQYWEKEQLIKSNSFIFVKELGQGHFGRVFLARHVQTGCIVAIKRVSKQKLVNNRMVDRFIEEIKVHTKLDHPNIVKCYGFYEQIDNICLILQYLNSGTLFDELNQLGVLTLKQTVSYLRGVIDALVYLHSQKIVHRDIKPENIMISPTGLAKLCDFGWSTIILQPRLTFCGTLDYASPEIIQHKKYDQSVDVWGVGILTYEMLVGRAPFENDDRETVMYGIVNVNTAELPFISMIPAQAREFIEGILQKDAEERPKITQLLEYRLFRREAETYKKVKKSSII